MKLIVDNTNVETIPVGNLRDVATSAHAMADEIGTDVVTLVALLIREDGMTIRVIGETASHYELMGLFEAAKLRVFADDVVEDLT